MPTELIVPPVKMMPTEGKADIADYSNQSPGSPPGEVQSVRLRTLLLCVADQRGEAVEAVHEFAVGQGDEQREHDAEMQREQRSSSPAVLRSTSSSKPVMAGQQQHDREADVHAELRSSSTNLGRARALATSSPIGPTTSPMPPIVPSTTGRSYQGYGASRPSR